MCFLAKPPKQCTRNEHRHGHKPKSGLHLAAEIGGESQPQRAYSIAQIAPETIDADGRATPRGVRDIRYSSGKIRIQQGHTKPGNSRGCCPPDNAVSQHHGSHSSAANPHTRHVEPMTADPIRQPAGNKLRGSPRKTIKADDPAYVWQTHAILKQEDWIENPDECIDKFLNQSSLTEGHQAFVAPAHQSENFASSWCG